jgi:hypothetical protein
MNENPILPARIIIFFPPLLYPKIFPPPTYHLPPASYLPPTNPSPPLTPSPELQRCRAGASLEQGSLEQGLRTAERLEPTRDPRGNKCETQVSI